jgi:hypothetical protein
MPETEDEMIDRMQAVVDMLRSQRKAGADVAWMTQANSTFTPAYRWLQNNQTHDQRRSMPITNPSTSKGKQVARDTIGFKFT